MTPSDARRRLLFFLLAASASARAELPPEGTRITTSDYTIDLGQTPVLSGNRVTGLAGAFVAIGEGTDGSAQNPAATAQRAPWSTSHFDFDVGLGITISSTIPNSDLFNSGKRVLVTSGGDQSFTFLGLAANLQFGRWGFGVAADVQEYSLSRGTVSGAEQADELAATFTVLHATAAYGFHDGQLLIGVGPRSITLNVNTTNTPDAPSDAERDLFEAVGVGAEAGVLIRPNDEQFRVGASFRTAVTATARRGNRTLYADDPENMLVLPERVTLPWDIHAGIAVQLGPRPFNPRWLDPSRELRPIRRYFDWRARERLRRRAATEERAKREGVDPAPLLAALDEELEAEAARDEQRLSRTEEELEQKLRLRYLGMERFYVLVTASVQVLGPVSDAVGVESFLERRVQRSGQEPSISPRLGVETEAIPNFTRIRAGTYLEPSRFASNPNGSRLHGTFGVEQRLFPWDVFGLLPEGSVFRVTGSIDVARAYLTWGLAIGMWH